jgi:hypothetical protein
MGQIKISELTPKEEPLSTSDLLIIAQETPDGFESRSITGRDIMQSIPAPEINPRTLESTIGLNLTGNTNQISASVLIPAGTIVTNNSIYIRNVLTKTAGSTTSTARIYINTSNSLTGATLLGTSGGMNSATYIQRFERNFFFDGTNLNVYNTTNAISTDLTSGTKTLFSFNPAIDYYLIFAVQNSTTTPDNLGHKRVIVQLYD